MIDAREVLVLVQNVRHRLNDVHVQDVLRGKLRQRQVRVHEVLRILVDAAGRDNVRDVPCESRNGSPVSGS